MEYICFDIGGTETKFAVINEKYQIHYKSSFPTQINKGSNLFLQRIIQEINKAKEKYLINGVGISSPGIINTETGEVIFANERGKFFQGINYYSIISKETHLFCQAENDANCFAIAETLNHKEDFLMLTIGTGIGGAIIMDNKVYRGINLSAGAFGQIRLTNNAKFEELSSVNTLICKGKQYYPDIKNGEDLFAFYDKGSPHAITIINEFYHFLSLGIINLAYIFSPPKIIIGGGITNRKSFGNELLDAINKNKDSAYFGQTKVLISEYKNDGGFIGALVNLLNKNKNNSCFLKTSKL